MKTGTEWAELILERVRAKGENGLPKSHFKTTAKAFEEALKRLVGDGQVQVARSGNSSVLFLKEHAPSLERAAACIESLVAAKFPTLLSKKTISDSVPSILRRFTDKALPFLIADGVLFELKSGKSKLYVHLGALDQARPGSAGDPPMPLGLSVTEVEQRVRSAYQELRKHSQFPSIAISKIIATSGVPKAQVHAFLLDQARQVQAVLSLGDWSLASPEVREGALEFQGERYLHIAFS